MNFLAFGGEFAVLRGIYLEDGEKESEASDAARRSGDLGTPVKQLCGIRVISRASQSADEFSQPRQR